MKIFLNIIRIFLGIVFILSASTKFFSLDEFEIYIFSHNFLSLNISFIVARVLIGFELFTGILLISNIYFKQIRLFSILTLVGFTVYLAIMAIKGSGENCHCFGEFLKMTPIESILKNGILLLLFIPLKNNLGYNFKYKKIISIVLLLICISLPTLISPPDFVYPEMYSKIAVVNKNGLDSLVLDNNKFPIKCDSGKKVLCFYSPQCRFCKLSEKKISSIITRNKLDKNKFAAIFWGNPKKLNQFYDVNSIKLETAFIETQDFFSITDGKMPLILLIEDKVIKEKFGYRSIDEDAIVKFLNE